MAQQWWERLPAGQRREYERSDAIPRVQLRWDARFGTALGEIDAALRADDCPSTEAAARSLVRLLCDALRVPRVSVRVLGMRPHDQRGELHGLYSPNGTRGQEEIKVWMRTAKRRDVVKTKTFLRTLLHEVCHHLDFFLFDLPHSFHSRGFYQRESSLLRIVARGTDHLPGRPRAVAAHGGPAPSPLVGSDAVDERAAAPVPSADPSSRGLALLRAAAAAIAARQKPDENQER